MFKIIISVIRWVLGLTLCFAAVGGFASGDTMPAFFTLIIGLLLLPPVTKSISSKQQQGHKLQKNTRNNSNEEKIESSNGKSEFTLKLDENEQLKSTKNIY